MPEQSHDTSANPQPTQLERALEQNVTALDSVAQSASELVVIHAVLTQEIPDDVQVGDIAHALERTDALETKISDAAQDLAQVNVVLAQQIDERADLERELAETKAALVEAKDASA